MVCRKVREVAVRAKKKNNLRKQEADSVNEAMESVSTGGVCHSLEEGASVFIDEG